MQILRRVDADVDIAPRLDDSVAHVEDLLRKQLLGLVVDRRIPILDVGCTDAVGHSELASRRLLIRIQIPLDGGHQTVA